MVVIYAASVVITRLLLSAAWWYAYDKPHLMRSSMEPVTKGISYPDPVPATCVPVVDRHRFPQR